MHHQHFQQRNVRAMRLNKSNVGLGGFGLDDDRLKVLEVARNLQLLFQVVQRNIQAFRYSTKVLLHQGGIVTKEEDAEGRIIINQDAAIAVQHAPARGYHWNGADAIAFRPLQVFVGIDNLQLPKAHQQDADHSYDDVGDDGQPLLRQSIVIAKPVRHENPARETLSAAAGRRFALWAVCSPS